MILQPVVAGGSTLTPVMEQLLGDRDEANKLFTTSKKILVTATVTPLVIWMGRTLTVDHDFLLVESGGVGTGFDTIDLTPWEGQGFLPRSGDSLFAFYFADPAFP